jgi:nucleoside-diphosphate kinase
MQTEKSLIILKPDCIQRNLVGEIISRFEKKGLKIVGIKMMQVSDVLLEEHYMHIKDKPFFPGIRDFMKSSPVIIMALEGVGIIDSLRIIVGPTKGYTADGGTIRGDFSMSTQSNLVHASDSPEAAVSEIARFFKEDELYTYKKIDTDLIYSEHV